MSFDEKFNNNIKKDDFITIVKMLSDKVTRLDNHIRSLDDYIRNLEDALDIINRRNIRLSNKKDRILVCECGKLLDKDNTTCSLYPNCLD